MGGVIKKIAIAVVVIGVIAAGCVYKYNSSRTYFNDDNVNGNSIGNLYGDGLFCEANGVVYFANPNDDNALYQMNPDESDVVKICDDRIYFINADSHYIYYSRNSNNDESQMSFLNVATNSLCRINLDGKNLKILDDAVSNALSLCGNSIYYYHYDTDTATTLYTVSIDGSDNKMVSEESIDPRCMVGDRLYYSGVSSDHYIHVKNVTTGAESTVFSEPAWTPIVIGDNLYYMNLDNSNHISVVSISDGSKTDLSSYGTSDFNVSGNYVYYQSISGNPDGLYKIDLTTKEETLIKEGEYMDINVTSKYVYFVDYFTNTVYHCSLDGQGVSIFNPSIELEK